MDEVRLRLGARAVAPGVVDALEEAAEGGGGEFGSGDVDGGEGGLGVGAELDVVEANDGNVAGDGEAGFVDGPHGSDGGEVVGAEDGGGWGAGGEHMGHGAVAAFDAVVGFDKVLGCEGETMGAE